mmetsp:Transcript_94655/g.229916  ORF Transcript_94655/g.229916 Transcript_94655/m.229916 type:complete len:377 (-) Transcript_94655:301-1431(-)
MKLFVAVSALLATGALAQTPAAAKADADLGETDCTKEVAGEDVDFTCDWKHTCHTSANKTLSTCVKKGDKVCNMYSKYAEEGDIISLRTCKPYETCCDTECCGVDKQCMEVYGDTGASNKVSITWDYNGPFDINDVARNDWKTKKGAKVTNRPRTCVPLNDAPVMDATTGFKAVYMPLLGLGVTALIFIMAIVKRQDTFLEMLIPLTLIFTSFFLVLTEGWIMALMCTFLAAATMASGDQDKKWLVWFQIFFMWFYFGGSSGFMFSQASGNFLTNFFTEASANTIKDLCGTCAAHFNYYKIHPYQLDYTQDPNDMVNQYSGICAPGFIGYQVFIAYGQAFALFLMVTTTVVGYLNPGEASATGTKNPAAAGVEMGA